MMMMILSPRAYPFHPRLRHATQKMAVQELREDVKVKPLIEEQDDLTNDTGDARCATPIRSLE